MRKKQGKRIYHFASLTVEISPRLSSSPLRIFLRMRRIIFPLRVLGRSSTTNTVFGAANGPIDFLTCATNSLRVASLFSTPPFRATKALTAWPVNSSAIPTTAASATAAIEKHVRVGFYSNRVYTKRNNLSVTYSVR